MTYTNTTVALDQYLPLPSLASKPGETRVILADFLEGKILSQDTTTLQLPTLNTTTPTLKDVASSVYRKYGIFSNPSHYQDLGQKEGHHYFLGNVNSKTTPFQGEWLSINDINKGTIPSSQKVKSLLEQIVYQIN